MADLRLCYAGDSVGCEYIASAYSMQPEQSKELVYQQVRKNFPAATEAALQRVLGWDR